MLSSAAPVPNKSIFAPTHDGFFYAFDRVHAYETELRYGFLSVYIKGKWEVSEETRAGKFWSTTALFIVFGKGEYGK